MDSKNSDLNSKEAPPTSQNYKQLTLAESHPELKKVISQLDENCNPQQEEHWEVPPSPPSSEPKQYTTPQKTPEPTFRNIDYSGMSMEELSKRSARRVKVMESGEEQEDCTWTDFKLRMSSSKKKSIEPKVSDFAQNIIHELNSPEENLDPESPTEVRNAECQTDEKALKKTPIRRSARLAERRKVFTELKRKPKDSPKKLKMQKME